MRIKFSGTRTMSRSFLFENYVQAESSYDFYCQVTTDIDDMGIHSYHEFFAVPKDRLKTQDYIKQHIYKIEKTSYVELADAGVHLLNINFFRIGWRQIRACLRREEDICFYVAVSPGVIRKVAVEISDEADNQSLPTAAPENTKTKSNFLEAKKNDRGARILGSLTRL